MPRGKPHPLTTRRDLLLRGAAMALPGLPSLARTAAAATSSSPAAPYLQDVRSDRAVLSWFAAAAPVGEAASQVELATSPGFSGPILTAAAVAALPDQPLALYRASIAGLRPATRYYYRLPGQPSTDSAAQSFVTAPDPATPGTPLRFLAIGDSGHVCDEQAQLIRRMTAEQASLLINTGDLAYPDAAIDTLWRNYLEPFSPLTRQISCFACAGNHDVDLDGGAAFRAVHALPGRRPGDPAAPLYYSFDWGDVHFAALDSNLVVDTAASAAMHVWLDRDLAATRKQWRIVFWHHTPFDEARGDEVLTRQCREGLTPLLERHGVQLVLAGHNHAYQRTKPVAAGAPVAAGRGITYLTTGGGGGGLHDAAAGPLAEITEVRHHYVAVDVDGARLTVRTVGVDGRELDGFQLRPLPSLHRFSLVNGASFQPAVSPGALATVVGGSLAFAERKAAPPAVELAGARVLLDDRALPLFFTSPSQINTQLPFDLAAGQHRLTVVNAHGASELMVDVGESAPGVFTAIRASGGEPVVGSEAARPVRAGERLSIYATGLGPLAAGVAPPPLSEPAPADLAIAASVDVLVGEVAVPAESAVLAAGGYGLYRVTFSVPAAASPGPATVGLRVNGRTSNTLPMIIE